MGTRNVPAALACIGWSSLRIDYQVGLHDVTLVTRSSFWATRAFRSLKPISHLLRWLKGVDIRSSFSSWKPLGCQNLLVSSTKPPLWPTLISPAPARPRFAQLALVCVRRKQDAIDTTQPSQPLKTIKNDAAKPFWPIKIRTPTKKECILLDLFPI